jgi:hypothetical protein
MNKLYKLLVVLFVVLCCKEGYAIEQDSIHIQGHLLKQNKLTQGSLEQFGTDKKTVLQFKIQNGAFSFSLPNSIPAGVYRLYFDTINEKPYLDLIVDGIETDIVFDCSIYGFVVVPVFHKSVENQKWYTYIEQSKKKIERLDLLFNYLSMYHSKDVGVDCSVMRIYQKERGAYYNLFDGFVRANKDKWCGLLVKNKPYYYSNLNKKPIVRDFIRKNFFWEGIDTNHLELLKTPLYEDLIGLYFNTYYLNPIENYTIEQKIFYLKKGIDVVIEKFSKNVTVKEFVRRYLKEYFKKINHQEGIDYVLEKKI